MHTHNFELGLVVTDLDGTLLADDKSIPAKNLEAGKRLSQKNIPLVLCTGRVIAMTDEYVRQLTSVEVVIASNGSFIKNVKTGEILLLKEYAPEVLKTLFGFCREHDLDYLAYDSVGAIVYYSRNSKRIEYIHRYNKIAQTGGTEPVKTFVLEDNEDKIFNGSIQKVLITELHGGDLQKARPFLASYPEVYAVPSMDDVIDVMPAGASKGNAVRLVADYYKVPLSNVCVFGDNENDISMLSIAGLSVCMVNGDEKAKKSAKYVSKKTNNEAGVAEELYERTSLLK